MLAQLLPLTSCNSAVIRAAAAKLLSGNASCHVASVYGRHSDGKESSLWCKVITITFHVATSLRLC